MIVAVISAIMNFVFLPFSPLGDHDHRAHRSRAGGIPA
jgi:hypothetical protein